MSEDYNSIEHIEADFAAVAAMDELLVLKESKGWQILMFRLKAEHDEALHELADIDCDDNKAIKHVQDVVKRFRWFEETIDEMIAQGSAIDQRLQEEHYYDEGGQAEALHDHPDGQE